MAGKISAYTDIKNAKQNTGSGKQLTESTAASRNKGSLLAHVTRKKGMMDGRIHDLSFENKISIGKNVCTWQRGGTRTASRGTSKGKLIRLLN